MCYLFSIIRYFLNCVPYIAGNLFSAAVFTLVALLVILIALICLVQLHTRLLDKFLPSTNVENDSVDEPIDEHSALQTVRDFKFRYYTLYTV